MDNPDIEYFKQQLNQKLSEIEVDNWVKYVAVDKNGEVWCYNTQPFIIELDRYDSHWNIMCKGYDKCKYLFNLDSECILCWKDLCIEWEEIVKS